MALDVVTPLICSKLVPTTRRWRFEVDAVERIWEIKNSRCFDCILAKKKGLDGDLSVFVISERWFQLLCQTSIGPAFVHLSYSPKKSHSYEFEKKNKAGKLLQLQSLFFFFSRWKSKKIITGSGCLVIPVCAEGRAPASDGRWQFDIPLVLLPYSFKEFRGPETLEF